MLQNFLSLYHHVVLYWDSNCFQVFSPQGRDKVQRAMCAVRSTERAQLFANVTYAKAGDIRFGTRTTDEMHRHFRTSYFAPRTCNYAHIRNIL